MQTSSHSLCSCAKHDNVIDRFASKNTHPIARAVLSVAARGIARIILRSAERQLQTLDDRMLKDIGLDRSEISSVLHDRTGERRKASRICSPGHGILGFRCPACS